MRLATPKVACKELGITQTTLDYWHQQGMIDVIITSNNVRRYDLDSLASKKNKRRLSRIPQALDPYRPHWVTPKEAREALGVTKNTLIKWEEEGKILTKRDCRNHRLFDLNSLYFD